MFKHYLLLMLSMVLTVQIFAISLVHICPQTYTFNQKTDIKVEIQQGLSDIDKIKVIYRIDKQDHWFNEEMKQDSPGSVYFTATFPAKYLTTNVIEYYFVVELRQGNKEYFPPQNETVPNYILEPDIAYGEADPGFVLLTDNPIVAAEDGYLLVVSFFALADEIDPKTIEVWVGGKNVTANSQIIPPTIVYKEEKPASGIVRALVRAKKEKNIVHSQIWSTEVIPSGRISNKLTYQGSVNFASNYYDYSNKNAAGYTKSNASSWADFYANYGKFNAQADIYLSSLEHSNSQPVNRYTIGVNSPHVDLFAGDYAPTFSQLTINGQNIRGIYTRLHTESVSFSVTQGETVRKTTSELDVDLFEDGIQKSGSFKQEALATRLQVGDENSFIFGLNFSHHKDEVSSLDSVYYMYETTDDEGNKSINYTTKAQENAVIGIDAQLNIPEQNIVLGAEIATSLLNTNIIPGALYKEEIEEYIGEDIPIDPQDLSDLFIINKNMIPFLPSRASIAWLAYFRTYFWNNLFNVQYAETGSSFNSFGSTYQMRDSRVISFTDNLNISRYLILSGGINLIEDNLMGHKSETNNTSSWYLQSILRVPKIPYLKLSYYNNLSDNEMNKDIDADFQKYENKTQSLICSIGYNITQIPYVPTQLDISYKIGSDNSYQIVEEENIDLTENDNNSLNLTMLNRFQKIPLTLKFAFSLNNNENLLYLTSKKSKTSNFFASASYSLWNDRINPYTDFRIISSSGAQNDRDYLYYSLGVEAYPLRSLSINTNIAITDYNNNNSNAYDYNNFIWRVLLTQRF